MKLRYFFAALGCRSQSRKQQKEFTQLENAKPDGERKTFAQAPSGGEADLRGDCARGHHAISRRSFPDRRPSWFAA